MTERFRRHSEDSSLLEWPDSPVEDWRGLLFEICPTLRLMREDLCMYGGFYKEHAPASIYDAFQTFKSNRDPFMFPLVYLVFCPLISLNYSAFFKGNLNGPTCPKWVDAKHYEQGGHQGLLFELTVSDTYRLQLSCGGNTREEAERLWKSIKKYFRNIPPNQTGSL
jgi:hypothetical protein